MRAAEATAILALVEGALFTVPLLPALAELRRKRDARPLEVIQKHAGDITHFARGFRNYIAPLQDRLRHCTETRMTGWGRLKNGEEYVLLGDDLQPFAKAANFQGSTCRWLIAAGVAVTLPNDLQFAKEIYAAQSLTGGERNAFRAILCDGNIHLQRDSETMRWAHAAGQFRVESGCRLYGRTSSEREIVIAPNCTFQRMHAPRIAMGSEGCGTLDLVNHTATGITTELDKPLPRRLVDGDVTIRPGEIVRHNLVARGALNVGARSQVLGSLKGYESVVLEENVRVDGSLISSGELRVGPGCRIGGPILAERHIEIASGAVCGTADSPTTVSSQVVQVVEGSLFFGTVWARELGWVVARA